MINTIDPTDWQIPINRKNIHRERSDCDIQKGGLSQWILENIWKPHGT